MKRAAVRLLAAYTILALPLQAHAATAQEDLYHYLLGKAAASLECPQLPATNLFCHPAKVTGSSLDARLALSYMREIDALMAPCRARDAESCFRQMRLQKAAGRLGWCSKTGPDRQFRSNVVWARCEHRSVIVVNRAQ